MQVRGVGLSPCRSGSLRAELGASCRPGCSWLEQQVGRGNQSSWRGSLSSRPVAQRTSSSSGYKLWVGQATRAPRGVIKDMGNASSALGAV